MAAERDAALLVEAIEARHPDPYRFVPRDELRDAAGSIDAYRESARCVAVVDLMGLLAMLGPRNGHSAVHALDDEPGARRAHPLRLHELDDGVFVVGAQQRDLVGSEVLAIDGVPIDDLVAAVTPLVAYDNEWTVRARRPSFLVDACVLRGCGVTNDDHVATFTLRAIDGSTHDIESTAISIDDYRRVAATDDWLPKAPRLAHERRRNERQWVELTPDGRAIHIGYNATRGDVTDFAKKIEAIGSDRGVEAIVLDLRRNGGGDNRTFAPVLDVMRRVAQSKPLAVLTSRVTFSAAMQLVIALEQQTPAVFVGEPTGGSPNQFGDAVPIELPSARVTAHVATIEWTTAGDDDERLTRQPDVVVSQSSSEHFADRDVTLDGALAAVL